MAPRSPNYFRNGFDPGESGVREWIGRWAEDTSDISVASFNIQCPVANQLTQALGDPLLHAARRSRDCELHVFLKYAAACWLRSCAVSLGTPTSESRYEVQMYFPDLELIDELHTRFGLPAKIRGGFDVRKAQILRPGDLTVDATHGCVIMVDAIADYASVEVGYTQPFNLLMPLLERLTPRAVWIPFPRGSDRAQFEVKTNSIASVVAYEFALK